MDNKANLENGKLKELDHFTGRYTLVTPVDPLQLCRSHLGEFGQIEVPQTATWCKYCPGHPDDTTSIGINRTNHGTIYHTTKPGPKLEMLALGEPKSRREGVGLREHKKPYGVDQNIVFDHDHSAMFSRLPAPLIGEGLEMSCRMLLALRDDPNLKNAFFWVDGNHVIKNSGLVHPQLHIYAEDDLFPRLKEEVSGCDWHYNFRERCLMCDVIGELEIGPDLRICETDNFLVFVPHAARYPFETWFVPRNHSAYFEESDPANGRLPYWTELATLTQTVIQKLEIILGPRFPYLLMLYNAPISYELKVPGYTRTLGMSQLRDRYHWRLRLKPLLIPTSVKEGVRGYSTCPLSALTCAEILRLSPEDLSAWINQ